MLTQAGIVGVVLLAGAMLLAAFFTYVYALKRQSYLLVWAGGWLAVALTSLGGVLELWLGRPAWVLAVEEWLLAVAALLF
ncbi:MAG: hypothetical protein ACRD33_02200, partial [Candidatus Acidiferrales bacterium]